MESTESSGQQMPQSIFNAITLRILLQSTETSDRCLTFENLSLDTTIRQLNERVRDRLDSRPEPERQRLIYRGRPLQADAALSAVLGPFEVCQ